MKSVEILEENYSVWIIKFREETGSLHMEYLYATKSSFVKGTKLQLLEEYEKTAAYVLRFSEIRTCNKQCFCLDVCCELFLARLYKAY